MFERYNEKARRVIFFARYEASQFGSPYIESEHLLLGILREGKSALNAVLGLTEVEDIRLQIEAAAEHSHNSPTSVDLPLSNESKRILAYAAEEAERLTQKQIGVEHLLLGILREEKCLGAKILHKQGPKLEGARKLVAEAKDRLAAGAALTLPSQSVSASSEEAPTARKPVTLQVVVTHGAEVLFNYPSNFGPPRIGESIRLTGDEGWRQVYRVQDVVREFGIGDPIALQVVNVRVTPGEAE